MRIGGNRFNEGESSAPFVGDQFVSLYLGATRVLTVPGPPTWDGTPAASGGSTFNHPFVPPANDGGAGTLGYRVLVNGSVEDEPAGPPAVVVFQEPGIYEIAVLAENGVGESPRLKTVYEYVED
jgi:hypothetical protein